MNYFILGILYIILEKYLKNNLDSLIQLNRRIHSISKINASNIFTKLLHQNFLSQIIIKKLFFFIHCKARNNY